MTWGWTHPNSSVRRNVVMFNEQGEQVRGGFFDIDMDRQEALKRAMIPDREYIIALLEERFSYEGNPITGARWPETDKFRLHANNPEERVAEFDRVTPTAGGATMIERFTAPYARFSVIGDYMDLT